MLSSILSLLGPAGIVGIIFWIWMLYDCLKRNNTDRSLWIWVILILNIVGASLYFVVCWLPRNSNQIPTPRFANQWRYRDALWQAQAEVVNIGKAHQYVKLGDVLYEMGDLDRAMDAYQQALEKDPEETKALWGAASVAIAHKHWELAQAYLQTLLKIRSDFAYGDASFAYGQVLFESRQWDAAEQHLQEHLRLWSHPQGYITLAKVQHKKGQIAEARQTLETMIIRVKSSVPFQYRKNKHFVALGEKLLRGLTRTLVS
ncbi:MAG: tetratricopeptide repeat protein [Leptolyngbyaceae cyanobacterium bins.59]|nr:tetratricopeptide repeat protein [Leptolyngbyaceae cyanobacterium bins.59]